MFKTFLLLSGLLAATAFCAGATKTRNVLFVTTDGLRWQDVFRGADEALMDKEGGGVAEKDVPALRREFGGAAPGARREKLMPFVWGTLAGEGQIFGNRELGSEADVTNDRWFSYPGYNELLTGRADPRITSNKPIPNRNVSVLEWLQGRAGFAGTVRACNAWNALPAILNAERSKIPMFTTGQKSAPGSVSPRIAELERLMTGIPSPWAGEHFDAFVQEAALDVIEREHPRVLYVNYGETDEWAHDRRYDRYLEATRRVDGWVRELWEKLQSIDQYRGSTSLVFTTDHGRGAEAKDWTSHGAEVPHSGQWWIAVMGPDTKPLGERRNCDAVTQSQTAETIAALLGENFRAAAPEAAPPIQDVLPH